MVVDAAFHLHTDLGPGFLESVYEAILARLLRDRGLSVVRQLAAGKRPGSEPQMPRIGGDDFDTAEGVSF